jgi:hypothetical protein
MYPQPNKVAEELDRFGLCDIRLDAALVALMVAVEVASRLLLSMNTAIVAAAQLVKRSTLASVAADCELR